jgi:hypothetical protein
MINILNIHDANEDGFIITPAMIEDLKRNKDYQYLIPIFFHACKSDDLKLVKYCLNDTELSTYNNLETHIESGFEQALIGSSLNVVSYFIFDLNMPKNGAIENLLTVSENFEAYFNRISKSNNNFISLVKNMFKAREDKESLENEISIKEEAQNKKLKI